MADLVGSIDLMRQVQEGDELAFVEFIKIVKEFHMPRYVGKYRGRNVVVSDDEIESEFLLGVWKAIPLAKLDVGNPVNFVCYKGQRRVQSLFRKNIRSETRYQCLECGHVGIMAYKAKVPICSQCATTDIHTWMVEGAEVPQYSDDHSPFDNAMGVSAETAWQLAVYGIQVEELRARLWRGRTRELFDILILDGINRDSSKNYIREIAEMWGVSQMRVNYTLRQLRTEVEAFYAEAEGV